MGWDEYHFLNFFFPFLNNMWLWICELNQSIENVANNMACQYRWYFSKIYLWNRIESVSMFCQFELLSTHKEPNIAYNFIRVTNDSMRFTQFSFMSHSWNLKCLSMQCDSLFSKFIKGVILLKRESWHGETDEKLVLDPKKNRFSSPANHPDF